MTAANIFKQTDAVHIVTDGAAIDAFGNIDHFSHKVTIMPHINAVACVRGTQAAVALFCAEMAKADSYDDLKKNIPWRIKFVMDEYGPLLAKVNPHALCAEIYVCGWSEKSGPDAYVLATTDLNRASGMPALTVITIGGCIVPGGPDLEANFSSLHASFDENKAIDLVRRQRESRTPTPDNLSKQGPAVIGGFVQLTTVRKDSITTRILKRWPDRIGEKIQPIAA